MRSALWASLLVAVVVTLSALSWVPLTKSTQNSGLQRGVVTPTVSTQEYGTMLGSTSTTTKAWQNGTGTYQFASRPFVVPFDAGGLALSNYSLAQLTFLYQFPGAISPMVNVSQSGSSRCTILVNCWNVTTAYSFVVYPAVSSTPVTAKIAAAFNPNGTTPATGLYSVPVVAQTQLQFSIFSSQTWSVYAGTNVNVSYTVSVPSGYTLNFTEVYIPWPGNLTVNETSLNVTLGGNQLTSLQTTAGGFYAIISGIGTTETLKATAKIAATTVGGWQQVPMGKAGFDGDGQQQWSNASWVNPSTYPYGGGFLLTTNYSYAVNPASLNVSVNGKFLKSSTFLLAGTIIEILPGTLLIAGGHVFTVQLKFLFLGAPPVYTASLTTALIGTFTVGDLLLTSLVLLAIYIAVEATTESAGGRRRRKLRVTLAGQSNGFWSAVFLFLFALIILAYFIITGNVVA